MPLASLRQYLERLPARQAELRLMLVEAASFPHLAEGARRNLARRLERAAQATPVIKSPTPAQLALVGIAVEFATDGNGWQRISG